MKRIKTFYKKWKQCGGLKLKILLIMAGVVFIYGGVCKGYEIYKDINNPVKYEISVISESGALQSDTDKIRNIEGVSNVTLVREQNIILSNYGEDKNIIVKCIDNEYIKNVYGINNKNIEYEKSNVVYVNKSGYREIAGQDMLYNSQEHENYEYKDIITEGKINDKKYIFNVVYNDKLEEETKEENTMLCVMRDNGTLQVRADIWVYFHNDDITGDNIRKLQNEGYYINNSEKYLLETEKRDKELVRVKYNLIIGVMCMAFSVIAGKVD